MVFRGRFGAHLKKKKKQVKFYSQADLTFIQGVPNSKARPKWGEAGDPNEQKIVWKGGLSCFV